MANRQSNQQRKQAQKPAQSKPQAPAQTAPVSAAPTPAPAAPVKESTYLRLLRDQLKRYTETMEPGKPVATKAGVSAQVALYGAITGTLRQTGSDFTECFTELLSWVYKNRSGVCDERRIMRFYDSLTLAKKDLKNFEHIINVLLVLADPATRRVALKQVNLTTALSGFTPEIHSRVMEFFSPQH